MIQRELKAKQKIEALKHIEILTKTFQLNRNLALACLNTQLEVCYDYGDFTLLQAIEEDSIAARFVRSFEKLFDAYAYYVIDDISVLVVLHVSHNENAWESLRPVPGSKEIYAAVIDTVTGAVEFCSVLLKARSGTLLWVDPFSKE